MKRKIRTCAMMAILSLSMAGCQKDNLMFDKTDVNSNIPMRYSVSGTVYTTFLSDESELDSFIDRVFAIVNDGYTVTIIGNGQRSIKEKKRNHVHHHNRIRSKSVGRIYDVVGI